MKLISMTTFIEHQNMEDPYNFKGKVLKYSRFLKQHLKLEMFVPCDNEGNVLENPICQVELEQYRKAKEKVLFEGCLLQKFKDEPELKIISFKRQCVWMSYHTNLKIEDITHYDLELTQNATKQFL